MSIFDRLKQPLKDQYLARPEHEGGRLVWKHPNQNLVQGTKVTVRSDEEALFFREGRLVGQLGAGSYIISSENIPWLTDLVLAPMTGGNQYLAEVFFVRKAEFRHSIGPRELGSIKDLDSRHAVKIYGSTTFALQVTDPAALVTQLGGQDSGSEERALEFVTGRLTNALRAAVGRMAAEKPVLQIVSNAFSDELGRDVQERILPEFASQGLHLKRFLDLQLSLAGC